jgi:hexose kinase, 1-phosphofructokinase family
MKRILCIGPTPAAQRVMVFPKLTLNEVNRAATTLDGAAGKSVNVAKVLKALGEKPIATGFIGGNRGAHIEAILKERGIESEFIRIAPETRQCTTVIDESAGTITELVQESDAVPTEKYRQLMEVIRKWVSRCQAMVISGTLTPRAPTDFYRRCTELARECSLLSVVDAKGPALIEALKGHPGVVKPNRSELAATVGRELSGETNLMSEMRELCDRGAQRVIVTSGKDPTVAFDGERFWRINAPKINAVNPIGSGDAFTAGLVWRLLRGADLGEACRWASAAGAANALTMMAGEVRRKDFQRLVAEVKVQEIE